MLSYEEPSIAFHPSKYRAGIRTVACYPLLVSGQPIGALYFGLYSDRQFTLNELLTFDTFVQLAAVAIYYTRQYHGINRALQRKIDELERVQDASRLISSRLNLDGTLHEILNTALELIQADYGSFGLLDKSTGLLRRHVTIGGTNDERDIDEVIDSSSGIARSSQPALVSGCSRCRRRASASSSDWAAARRGRTCPPPQRDGRLS